MEGKGGASSALAPTGTTAPIVIGTPDLLTPFDNGDSGAGTITFDFSLSINQVLTLTGNPTLAFSSLVAGQTYTVKIIQDATGSRTVTWPGVDFVWLSGSAPTLATAPGAFNLILFYYDGATLIGGI